MVIPYCSEMPRPCFDPWKSSTTTELRAIALNNHVQRIPTRARGVLAHQSDEISSFNVSMDADVAARTRTQPAQSDIDASKGELLYGRHSIDCP
jgi:hypothetical protein